LFKIPLFCRSSGKRKGYFLVKRACPKRILEKGGGSDE